MIGIGIVGYGYWGPNLARNFSVQPACRVAAICEIQPDRQALAARQHPAARITADYEDLLKAPDIQAIVVATPVSSHHALAKAALLAGKDVLVEKPLAATVTQAEELVQLAAARNCILAVDHTFLFTGAVRKIKAIVDEGLLGELLYFDSVRINLGLFQNDVNVISDLAPHDLSILMHLIGKEPSAVRAMGAQHGPERIESLAYLHLEYDNNFLAHFHFSWLAPVKIRNTILAGSNKMLVYNDLEPTEKVKIYDKGITISADAKSAHKLKVDYRTGDMLAPKLIHREALSVEAEHFLDCVRQRNAPLASGLDGLKVVRVLEAAQQSLSAGGKRIAMRPT